MGGIETWRKNFPFHCRINQKEAEACRIQIDCDPSAAANSVRDSDGMDRVDARRESAERVARPAEGLLDRPDALCGGAQMMPFLIAVAIAIALLLADNF